VSRLRDRAIFVLVLTAALYALVAVVGTPPPTPAEIIAANEGR
jgi:hypothetical protein